MVTDNFDRADTTAAGTALGAAWDSGGSYYIASNQATKGVGDHRARYLTDLGGNDLYVEADITRVGTGVGNVEYVTVAARANASDPAAYTGYLDPLDGHAIIEKLDSGGGFTEIGNNGSDLGIGLGPYTLRLEVEGTAQRLYVNGTLRVTASDSSITSGHYVAFGAYTGVDGRPKYNNFSAGTLGAAAITGTIAVTLAAATGTFTATRTLPAVTGTVAVTLTAATSSIAGTTTTPGVAGSIAVTLTATTGSFTATRTLPAVTGTIAVTLAATTGLFVQVATFTGTYPASISGRKLLDQHGNVYLAHTFSSWSMASHLSNADITQALTDATTNHFNGVTVWMGGTEDRGGTGWDRYTNLAGQNFWTGTPWASTLGPAWASVDRVVDEAARLGLVVHFSFCAGYASFGPGTDWDGVTNADMHQVGVDVATRYAAYPNIVWHIMFDSAITVASTRGQRANALFDGINDTEGATTRPVRWVETDAGASTSGQGWYDPTGATTDTRFSINCMYEYSGSSVVELEAVWGEVSGPVGDCEPFYVGNPYPTGDSAQQYRERNYAVFVEGGSLLNFGHEAFWPFGADPLVATSLTWTDVVTQPEVVQARYAWDLIDTYCKDSTWAPTSSFVTTGEGTTDTKAAQGASNTAALAYFPDNRTVQVDTTIIAGTANVRLRWYDPTAGTFSTITASEAQSAGRSVTLPAARGDGTRDYVLVVDSPGDASVTATIVTATVSVLTPTVTTVSGAAPAVVTATAAVLTPTVKVGQSVTATVTTATTSVLPPGISAGSTVSVTATIVTASVSVVAATAGAGAGITANVVTATAASLAITPSIIGQRVSAAAVTATAAVLAVSILTGTIFELAPHIRGRQGTGIIRGSD
jgi:hypothetical protein